MQVNYWPLQKRNLNDISTIVDNIPGQTDNRQQVGLILKKEKVRLQLQRKK
jgi:hypothetical protein